MYLRGVTSYLYTESLTQEEFEAHDYPRVELTSQHLTWDPSSTIFEDKENQMPTSKANVPARTSPARGPLIVINSITTSSTYDAADVMADDNFGDILQSHVNVPSAVCDRKIAEAIVMETNPPTSDENPATDFSEMLKNNGDMVSTRRKMVDSATLAKRWDIDPGRAKNTVKMIPSRGG